jgi:hypothetical protein
MIEYIANRKVEDIDEAVRFIGVGRFAVFKYNQVMLLPDDFEEDPKEVLGDEFDRISEFRTFYDPDKKRFQLLEINPDKPIPESYIPIPYDGGEIDGWTVGRLDSKRNKND